MKKVLLIIFISIIFQSCHTYKSISIDEVRVGKNYVVKLKEGRTFNAKCKKTFTDSVLLTINKTTVKFPKSKIESIKRDKISSIKLIGGGLLFTTGIIILINDTNKDQNIIFQETN